MARMRHHPGTGLADPAVLDIMAILRNVLLGPGTVSRASRIGAALTVDAVGVAGAAITDESAT
jgi:hypothetical protein